MNRSIFVLLVTLGSLLLSGCYQSAQPLIAANAGDFPFPQRARYAAFEWNAGTQAWDGSEPGLAVRDGDHYVQTPDGSAPGDATAFMLKSIGGSFYIGQEEADSHFVYDLLKIEGDAIYEYGLTCDDAARLFQSQGLIDTIESAGLLGNTCTVSNFDRLAQVFRAAAGRQPKAKFVIAR
jgi:hypothetical protein